MIDVVQFSELFIAIKNVDQLENVRNNFICIVQCKQYQCNSLEAQEICEGNERKATNRMNDLWLLIFFLDFLQIQFRQHVKVVGQLNDEKQFVQENHRMLWKLVPKK